MALIIIINRNLTRVVKCYWIIFCVCSIDIVSLMTHYDDMKFWLFFKFTNKCVSNQNIKGIFILMRFKWRWKWSCLKENLMHKFAMNLAYKDVLSSSSSSSSVEENWWFALENHLTDTWSVYMGLIIHWKWMDGNVYVTTLMR